MLRGLVAVALNAVPNPAGKFVKSDPSPTKLVAVITPAFPSFILFPTSIDAAESPDEWRFEDPVLKLDAEDIPVVLTWLWIWILPAWSNFKASLVSFICSVNWLSIPAGVVILVIPYILFWLICDIDLFIRRQHNYRRWKDYHL